MASDHCQLTKSLRDVVGGIDVLTLSKLQVFMGLRRLTQIILCFH